MSFEWILHELSRIFYQAVRMLCWDNVFGLMKHGLGNSISWIIGFGVGLWCDLLVFFPDSSAVRVLVGFNRVKHPHVVGAFAAGPLSSKCPDLFVFQFSRHQFVVRASRSTNS